MKVDQDRQKLMKIYNISVRRKFRSQTSDNIDRWKGRWEESDKRREEEDQRRARVRRQKMQVREKVAKSRNTVFFLWFVAPEGRKVGSLKRRVRSPSGEMRDEKLHASVARSTFRNQNAQNTSGSEQFWKLRCWKKCTPLWREACVEIKTYKPHQHGSTFGRWDVQNVHGVVARSTVRSKNVQNTPASDFSFGKMILCDMCSTSYDLASLFRGRRNTSETCGKITKRIGTRPSALHSTFHFWRMSRRIASFLKLSTSIIEEVSQNCFVFDVVKVKIEGTLQNGCAFWCCQIKIEDVSQ